MLARVAADEADIAALDQQIADRLAPHAAQMAQLMTVPGIDWVFAATIIAEIGLDMSVFPSAGHLAVWTGACPGNNQSAGQRKPAGARTRNPSLKPCATPPLPPRASAAASSRSSTTSSRAAAAATRRYVRRLHELGFSVLLQPLSKLQPDAPNAL